MRHALIYRPSKSAMQSGQANRKLWKLDVRSDDQTFVDPTMGWIGSRDTTCQIKLDFASLEEAVAYAEENKLPYEVLETHERSLKKKAYADNFAFKQRRFADIAAQDGQCYLLSDSDANS